MRELNPQEKRTVRFAAIGIAVYLALFCCFLIYKKLANVRSDYRRLVAEASELRQEIRPYPDKVEHARKLMEGFRMDPMTLSATSLVARASAAIQAASSEAGMEAGPIRESASHAAKEAGTIQFETSGPVAAVLALLHKLQSTGYPLILDSVQMTPDNRRPGSLKVNMTILILDFDQWKLEARPNA